jgi:hypothetical protein
MKRNGKQSSGSRLVGALDAESSGHVTSLSLPVKWGYWLH